MHPVYDKKHVLCGLIIFVVISMMVLSWSLISPNSVPSNIVPVGCRIFHPNDSLSLAEKPVPSSPPNGQNNNRSQSAKIGMLYIATGKYITFLDNFLQSFDAHFLHGFSKTYFIFTDANMVSLSQNIRSRDDLVFIYTKFIGWPYETLYRFKRFNSAKDVIESSGVEYLFFTNGNLICLEDIGTEVLPSKEHEFLTVTRHPGFVGKDSNTFTYERNPRSLAYISPGDGKDYFAGGLYGGRTKEFMEFSAILEGWTNDDERRGIIPLWHDESLMNRFMLGRNPLILPPSYLYPEGWNLGDAFRRKIIVVDKNKHGGNEAMRNVN